MNIDIHYHIAFLGNILVTQITNQLKQCLKYQQIHQVLKEIFQRISVRKSFIFYGKYILYVIYIIFSGFKFENEFRNVLNTSLNICNERAVINPLISSWYFVFVIICIILSVYLELVLYTNTIVITTLFIVFIMWIYNLVTKWTEQNCVRGFRHRIETLFYNQ